MATVVTRTTLGIELHVSKDGHASMLLLEAISMAQDTYKNLVTKIDYNEDCFVVSISGKGIPDQNVAYDMKDYIDANL